MKHQVGAVHCAAAHGFVPQIAAQELNATQYGRQVRGASGGEIVDHAHAVPQREQTLDEVGPDEAGAPGDEGDRT